MLYVVKQRHVAPSIKLFLNRCRGRSIWEWHTENSPRQRRPFIHYVSGFYVIGPISVLGVCIDTPYCTTEHCARHDMPARGDCGRHTSSTSYSNTSRKVQRALARALVPIARGARTYCVLIPTLFHIRCGTCRHTTPRMAEADWLL